MSPVTRALARLIEILDRMEIRYALAGSVASSAHGAPRTTMDVDLVVDLRPEQIDEFAEELQQEFYVDPAQIRDAFSRGRAANLIHLKTAWKFDLFPLMPDEYSQLTMGRRSFRDIHLHTGSEEEAGMECAVIAPEDTILRKLQWYRAGGESSQQQWSDLRGICKSAGHQLDIAYLRGWAARLQIGDLLEKLLTEFGLATV
jgi:hypothetical protein